MAFHLQSTFQKVICSESNFIINLLKDVIIIISKSEDHQFLVTLGLCCNIYSRHNLFFKQETYQDPTAVNVNSDDFKALPAEIQHELIKEIKEEKKWMNKMNMPRVR